MASSSNARLLSATVMMLAIGLIEIGYAAEPHMRSEGRERRERDTHVERRSDRGSEKKPNTVNREKAGAQERERTEKAADARRVEEVAKNNKQVAEAGKELQKQGVSKDGSAVDTGRKPSNNGPRENAKVPYR